MKQPVLYRILPPAPIPQAAPARSRGTCILSKPRPYPALREPLERRDANLDTAKRQPDMLHGPIWNKILKFALLIAAAGSFTGDPRTVSAAAVSATSASIGRVSSATTRNVCAHSGEKPARLIEEMKNAAALRDKVSRRTVFVSFVDKKMRAILGEVRDLYANLDNAAFLCQQLSYCSLLNANPFNISQIFPNLAITASPPVPPAPP